MNSHLYGATIDRSGVRVNGFEKSRFSNLMGRWGPSVTDWRYVRATRGSELIATEGCVVAELPWGLPTSENATQVQRAFFARIVSSIYDIKWVF